ncbi:MAG: hypothetical protein IKX39_01425 [Muribaculaceae bacterium]|nr:hypothetical protein [Muribaculaceae bacterium]
MKRILTATAILLLAMISVGCRAQYVPQRGDYTFKTQVFTTTDEEGSTIADSILTTVTDKMGKSFTLVSYTEPLDPDFWQGFGGIREDDINFDGTPDLMICLGPTNSFGGFTYDGYIWDTATHKFVRVEHFDEILDPQFFPEKNQILGTFRIDSHYWFSLYEWQNGKLVLIEESCSDDEMDD